MGHTYIFFKHTYRIKMAMRFGLLKGTVDMPQCGFSQVASRILTQFLVVPDEDLHTINVLENYDIREGIKKYSDWPTIPQVYLNGEFLGGCDILVDMYKDPC